MKMVNAWVEGGDGAGCPTAPRGWLAEGSTMACFELMHKFCLRVPFSSNLYGGVCLVAVFRSKVSSW